MKSYSLLFISFFITIALSCNKRGKNDYDKNSVQLTVNNSSGTIFLEWDQVKTTDFVAYEIYRSKTNSIDIINGTADMIATINKPETHSFSDDSFVLDTTFNSNQVVYYKVAVVLKGRKLSSETKATAFQKNMVSGKNYTFVGAIPENDLVIMRHSFDGTFLTYSYESNSVIASKLINSPSLVVPFVGSNGKSYLASVNGGIAVDIVNASTLSTEQVISLSNLSALYSMEAHKDYLYLMLFEQGELRFKAYNYATNTLAINASLGNAINAAKVVLSRNKNKLFAITDNTCLTFSVNADGSLVYLSTTSTSIFNNGGSNIATSWDGSYLCTFTPLSVFNTSTFETVASFQTFNTQSLSFMSDNSLLKNEFDGIVRTNFEKNETTDIFKPDLGSVGGFQQMDLNSFEDNNKIYIFISLKEDFSFSPGPTFYITKPIQ